MDFFSCIVKNLVEMVVLAAIGIIGGWIGIKLRRRKDAKDAAERMTSAEKTED